jgi:hypothetical protein
LEIPAERNPKAIAGHMTYQKPIICIALELQFMEYVVGIPLENFNLFWINGSNYFICNERIERADSL